MKGLITKNFGWEEPTIPCPCCGDNNISMELMWDLQKVRDLYGESITITSGVRCAKHNKEVGGVGASAHVPRDGNPGLAVDVGCTTSRDRFLLLPLLFSRFQRIGMGRSFIHVDIEKTKPQDVIWDYYSKSHVA